MSKLIKAIKTELTGRRKLTSQRPLPDMVSVKKEITAPSVYSPHYEYEIKVTFGANGFCLLDDLERMQGLVVEQLAEEMYGEFRDLIRALEFSIFENMDPPQEVRTILDSIKKEIY